MLSVALLLPLLAAGGSGLGCAGVADPIEQAVCRDPALTAKASQLSGLYATALQQLPSQRSQQEARQRAWHGERNACAKTQNVPKCLTETYDRRNIELAIRLGRVPVFATVRYLCKGHESTPVSAAYYRTDPASVLLGYHDQEVVALVAASGSGSRYTAHQVEIWEHQGEARFTWHGTQMTCTIRR